jgi:hypothetical protein
MPCRKSNGNPKLKRQAITTEKLPILKRKHRQHEKEREKKNSRFAGTKFRPFILAIDPKSGMYLKKSIKEKESLHIQFLFLTSSLVLVGKGALLILKILLYSW